MKKARNRIDRHVYEEDAADDGWIQRDDLRWPPNLQVEIL